MFTLSYTSTAIVPFTNASLYALLVIARAANAGEQITGALLYRNSRFIQVLEGDESAVRDLFARIAADPRHRVDYSIWEHTPVRRFATWNMSYQSLDDSELSDELLVDGGIRPRSTWDAVPSGVAQNEAAFDRLYSQWDADIDSALPSSNLPLDRPNESDPPAPMLLTANTAQRDPDNIAPGLPAKTQITASGVVAAVFDIIMHEIDTGALRPGDRVNDQTFATALGVSRTPVREALQKLRDLGVVEVSANRFTRISVIEPEQARQLITVLSALYLAALEEVIGQTTSDLVDSLTAGRAALANAIATTDPALIASAGVNFFLILAKQSTNPALMQQIQSMAHVVKLASAHLDALIGYGTILASADALITAAAQRDVNAAKRAVLMLTAGPQPPVAFSGTPSLSPTPAPNWQI